MNNKKTGNDFEKEFAEKMAKKGYWVHLLNQGHTGQPADIIAVKKKTALLIDCKVCTRDYFTESRIEENQHLAMKKWEEKARTKAWFALKTSEGIYMIPYRILLCALRDNNGKLDLEEIKAYGSGFYDWSII